MTCTVDRALKVHCLSICCILSLCLSRSEVLRSLRHYLWAQSQGYHNTDRLEKRHRKRKPSIVFCEWNTHHQFDQHWNYSLLWMEHTSSIWPALELFGRQCFGNSWDWLEHTGFPKHMITTMNWAAVFCWQQKQTNDSSSFRALQLGRQLYLHLFIPWWLVQCHSNVNSPQHAIQYMEGYQFVDRHIQHVVDQILGFMRVLPVHSRYMGSRGIACVEGLMVLLPRFRLLQTVSVISLWCQQWVGITVEWFNKVKLCGPSVAVHP